MKGQQQNTIEKIIQNHVSENKEIKVGDYVAIRPDYVMTHNNTSSVIKKFLALKKKRKIKNKDQIVVVLDHASPAPTEKTSEEQKIVRNFMKKEKIKNFFDINRGVCHQVLSEEGFIRPGCLVLGSDSHTTTYGAFGALGIPIVRTDASVIWATEKTWLQVPEVIKINLEGKLSKGISGKDIILHIIGALGADYCINKGVEYHGSVAEKLSIGNRMTIANMTVEMGGIAGVFQYDKKTRNWFRRRKFKIEEDAKKFKPDRNAVYHSEITFELTNLTPRVSCPHSVDNVHPVSQFSKIKINQGVIGTCTNGRIEDIEITAKVLKGRKIHKDVRLIVIPASSEIYLEAIKKGFIETLIKAGATVCNPNCGPCLGQHQGALSKGEIAISSSNRNFQGRMGSRDARIYLASPETVAYSSLLGHIACKDKSKRNVDKPKIKIFKRGTKRGDISIKSELKNIKGRGIILTKDNINTDGIYAGKHTYVQLTNSEMTEIIMENYDPLFRNIVKEGDILIAGNNFGCGSSREQAITALKAKKIRCIIAKSFSNTFYRNAINNGFLIIECPELVRKVECEIKKRKERTIPLKEEIKINISKSEIVHKKEKYQFTPIPPLMQKIIFRKGLIGYINSKEKWNLTEEEKRNEIKTNRKH